MPADRTPGSRSTLVLSLLAQSVAMLPVFLTGSLYPLIAVEITLPPERFGTVIATFFAFSALASATFAPIADRMGPWTVTRFCLFTLFLALGVLATSRNEFWLYLGMAIAGSANGCIQPATNVAISRFVIRSRQGIAFGLKQSAIPFATLLAGFAVPVIGLTLGWRAGYGVALALVVGLTIAMPRAADLQGKASSSSTGRPNWRFILLVSALAGLGAGSANAMAAFIVGYGVHLGIGPATAGFVVASGSALSIATRLGLGFAADRHSIPIFIIVSALLLGGSVGYAILALQPGVSLFALATILAFAMGWGWAGVSLLGVVRASGDSAGRVTGLMQAGLFTGAVIGPLVFGWLVAQHSYSSAWMVLAIVSLIAAFLGMLLHGSKGA